MPFLLAALAFGVLIAFHEAGHMWVARRLGMRVERFSIGFGPVVLRRQKGDTEYALSAIPLGGYVKISGMSPEDEVRPDDPKSYANKPAWARLLVIAAGPVANYVLAFLIGVPLLMTAVPVPNLSSTKIGTVVSGGPAATAGLEPGDEIQRIGSGAVKDFGDIQAAVKAQTKAHPGQPFDVEYLRGQTAKTAVVTPKNGLIGVTPATKVLPPLPFIRAVGQSFVRLGVQTADSAGVLKMLFTGKAGVKDLSGPIGMISQTVAQAKRGLVDYFETVWFLSVAIGFFNLLPIPALDGGRGVFLLYELVSRRKVNQRVEAMIHTVGLVALFGLILYVSKGDLAHLFHRG